MRRNRIDVSKLSREDLMEIVKRIATTKEAPKPRREDPDWTKVKHTCPKCDRSGPVDPMFGTRPNPRGDGTRLRQSWCAECRAGTNYHARPRKNRMAADE